jgi:hypothetical protein
MRVFGALMTDSTGMPALDVGTGSSPARTRRGTVGDPDYVPYPTPALVCGVHAAGMAVVAWTSRTRR